MHSTAKRSLPSFIVLAAAFAAVPTTSFAESSYTTDQERHIRSVIEDISRGAQVTEITTTPVDGIVSVEVSNGATLYSTLDAKHFFVGELYELKEGEVANLTEIKRQALAKRILDATSADSMIVYKASAPKATITVMTDVDCPYCQKLHGDVPALNAMGITVRYMAFPRAGVDSETSKKMQSIWCSDDPKSQMSLAMANQPIDKNICEQNPVSRHYEIAQAVKANGTPTIIMGNGFILPGYNTPDVLVETAIKNSQ